MDLVSPFQREGLVTLNDRQWWSGADAAKK